MKPTIIADVGSNHRGSLEIALKQIECAKSAGCDVVKFQLFSAIELYGFPVCGVDEHSIQATWIPELKECCDKLNIEFMCTAFSPEGVRLVNPFVKTHKLASSEFTHYEIIDAIKATNKPWIASTGGAHFSEIEQIIHCYQPTALLECVARYPSPIGNYDVATLKKWLSIAQCDGDIEPQCVPYDLRCGISDHTTSNGIALASIGFGATIFEKHFDGVFGLETPDSPVSYDLAKMEKYVKEIHEAFSAVGDGIKQPRHQHEMALKWRRRLIVTDDLPVGAKLKAHINYGIYRSTKDDTRGAKPILLEKLDGKTLKVEKKKGDSLWVDDAC